MCVQTLRGRRAFVCPTFALGHRDEPNKKKKRTNKKTHTDKHTHTRIRCLSHTLVNIAHVIYLCKYKC